MSTSILNKFLKLRKLKNTEKLRKIVLLANLLKNRIDVLAANRRFYFTF